MLGANASASAPALAAAGCPRQAQCVRAGICRRQAQDCRAARPGGRRRGAPPPPAAAGTAGAAAAAGGAPPPPVRSREGDVLAALSTIMDPDFGMNIVDCGFVKDLAITPVPSGDPAAADVAFRLELTTPACPVKGEFERAARAAVGALPWVRRLDVTMDARPPAPAGDPGAPAADPVPGLRRVAHVVAVSSCKGGVGKSTTAVNLAFTLAGMGARVGIFDADVYGPSLPTMAAPAGGPAAGVLVMDPETRAITPVDLGAGVVGVSFGWAGQGAAIMRGAMVSGLVQQLLGTAEWGALDYLIVDFPPGTGDVQLTLCQAAPFSAAVVVTTPQKLAYVDVAKGVRMFARLAVPCVAVVENMAFFDGDDGKRYYPFGAGSGERLQREFGLPHLVRFPIAPALSSAGDAGVPAVAADPAGPLAAAYAELGAAVVRECAKLRGARRAGARWDAALRALVVRLPPGAARGGYGVPVAGGGAAAGAADPQGEEEEFALDAAAVRRADTSARAIDEWTGVAAAPAPVPDGIEPAGVQPLGNYAVQISWADGANQVAPYALLAGLPRLGARELEARRAAGEAAAAAAAAAGGGNGAAPTAAQQILQGAKML